MVTALGPLPRSNSNSKRPRNVGAFVKRLKGAVHKTAPFLQRRASTFRTDGPCDINVSLDKTGHVAGPLDVTESQNRRNPASHGGQCSSQAIALSTKVMYSCDTSSGDEFQTKVELS